MKLVIKVISFGSPRTRNLLQFDETELAQVVDNIVRNLVWPVSWILIIDLIDVVATVPSDILLGLMIVELDLTVVSFTLKLTSLKFTGRGKFPLCLISENT